MRTGVSRHLPQGGFPLAGHRLAQPYDWTESYTVDGACQVKVYPHPLPIPRRSALAGILLAIDTAPTGADLIADLRNGTTSIFTNLGNRPRILAGAKVSELVEDIDLAVFEFGDVCKFEIVQVGSAVAGSDLVCHTYWRFAL
jgi:hypothetical protein